MRDFDWEVIAVLSKTRNITKTANLLFLSQPALTKRIQAIEEELGAQLLVRGRRGSKFTLEGERIAQKAERVIEAIREAKGCINVRDENMGGTLRLGVPYSYVRYVMPALLAEYTAKYPNVKIEIITALSDELARSVEDGMIDICFARYNAEDSYLQRHLVSEDQFCAVYNHPFDMAELPNIPYIEYNTNHITTNTIFRWWNDYYSTELRPRFRVYTGDCCVSMIRYGLGFGIFTDSKYFSYDSKLYALPLTDMDGNKLMRKTWLLYKKEMLNHPIVSKFIDFTIGMDMSNIKLNE